METHKIHGQPKEGHPVDAGQRVVRSQGAIGLSQEEQHEQQNKAKEAKKSLHQHFPFFRRPKA